jgi:glyoxylase-like metal-dependent hydrolase (beta-lactamase superfamily II)
MNDRQDKVRETTLGRLQVAVVTVTPFQQNCTLIWDSLSKRGVIIDPGGDLDEIRNAIARNDVAVEAIYLTHGHIDHAGGAQALKEQLGVDIIGPHEADRPLLEGIEKQAQMFGVPGAYRNAYPDRFLKEGDRALFGGHEFEVFHCPGHAPGHVVYVNRRERFAQVGDVLFSGSVGRTDLPGGSHQMLIGSIKQKLLPLGDDISFICGHGPGSTFGCERATNPFLK